MFRQRVVHLAVIVCAALIVAAPGPVSSTAFLNQFNVYFGNLHAHTTLSDGSGAPKNAFTMARSTAKLDFLAVTEHNHSAAAHPKEAPVFGTGIAAQHSLYSKLTTAAKDADVDDEFVALFGQEFSTISSGNHMNVIGASKVIDETDVPSGDFKELYTTFLPGDSGVRFIQMNHPWENSKAPGKNYGLEQFGKSFTKLRNASEPWLRTIEVINGPGLKEGTDMPASVKGEGAYLKYLTRGFHIAPTADQDNHRRNWGTATPARTGVLATRLTRQSILTAIDRLRVYASTDNSLEVKFGVNGAVMGSNVTSSSRDLNVVWSIHDANEPNAKYRVSAVVGRETVAEQKTVTKLADQNGDGEGGQTFHTTFQKLFLYLKIVQESSSKDDTVITSPVWITIE